jgi:tetratricopeptide (TPR) repeat protein
MLALRVRTTSSNLICSKACALIQKFRLSLLLSGLLIGAGFFYPHLAAFQERNAIEASLAADDLESAQKALDNLLAWDDGDARACYLKAVLLRRTGQIEQYKHWRAEAERLGMPASELNLQDRLLEVQLGDISKADEPELLAQAQRVATDQIAAETYEAIARGYLTTYRLKEAWQCLDFWLQWRPSSVSARLMRAEVLVRTGMPALAVEEYRKILEHSDKVATAKEKLAVTLLKLNEVEESAKLLRATCSENPNVSEPWIELAEAERRLGNLDAARQAIEKAMALGVTPRQRGQCCSILGQLSMAEQNPQQATGLLLVATELVPEDATAHHALGGALTFTGQSELGAKHREIAQRIRENYDQVQKWTRQVIETPNDPELRTNIGKALIEQGLRSEGLAWLRTALDCDAHFTPAQALLEQMAASDGPVP